jgi:hypothetical protein
MSEPVVLIASGDLRLSANQVCWPAQVQAEEAVTNAIRAAGREVVRGHPCDPVKGHGFIDSQKYGMEVFARIPPNAPIVVVEAVWQYSHHVLAGLYDPPGPDPHRRELERRWPGLVGMLNLNVSLTKAGVAYSTLWSEATSRTSSSSRPPRVAAGGRWRTTPRHVRPLAGLNAGPRRRDRRPPRRHAAPREGDHGRLRRGLHGDVQRDRPRRTAAPTGVFKERLSQSALYARNADRERPRRAGGVRLVPREGLRFAYGPTRDAS